MRPVQTKSAAGGLSVPVKIGFASGDHTVNAALSALSLFYLFFLTEVAGLRPALASAVLLVGRAVDAFTDPAMGRLSDRTTTRLGRRRPYFLLGALPFGITFALLWQAMPFDAQWARFAAYSLAYILHSLASTVLSVPYMALLPEMALGYHERTSLNVYRSAAAVLGTLLAAALVQPLVESFGGGARGYAEVGILLGIWFVLPWIAVYGVSWERPGFAGRAEAGFLEGAKRLAGHRSYRRLVGLYLCARIAVDIVGAMFLFYFTYWLLRPADFPLMMSILLITVVASLPFWLRLAKQTDKRTLFIFGSLWWVGAQLFLLFVQPDWPRAVIFAVAAAAGIGYAVADLMPWAMLGDVIDEDELESGERREGMYAGFFTFLRKLGGATGVAIAGVVLDLSGFVGGTDQTETTRTAIRGLTALAPALFLALGAWVALGYTLTRSRHDEIRRALDARNVSGAERGS